MGRPSLIKTPSLTIQKLVIIFITLGFGEDLAEDFERGLEEGHMQIYIPLELSTLGNGSVATA